MGTLEQALGAYQESDYSVKVCQTIFSVIPQAPPFVLYRDVDGAVRRVIPSASEELVAQARQRAQAPGVAKALRAADALDAADTGLAVVSGVRNIFSLFGMGGGRGSRTFESDPQQAMDAGAKLLGLAYMVWNLFEGDAKQKAAAFMALPAGREAAIYFAVAEAGLPFADNLVQGGASVLGRLVGEAGRAVPRFGALGGDVGSLAGAGGLVQMLSGSLGSVLEAAKGNLGAVTSGVGRFLPTVASAADSVTGAAATGLDVLPVWRFLGARLAAEACAAPSGVA
jgi:hypothetical protein